MRLLRRLLRLLLGMLLLLLLAMLLGLNAWVLLRLVMLQLLLPGREGAAKVAQCWRRRWHWRRRLCQCCYCRLLGHCKLPLFAALLQQLLRLVGMMLRRLRLRRRTLGGCRVDGGDVILVLVRVVVVLQLLMDARVLLCLRTLLRVLMRALQVLWWCGGVVIVACCWWLWCQWLLRWRQRCL